MEQQYVNYRVLLESDMKFDRSYIEGKSDAYREMKYFIEPFIYPKIH